MAALIASRRPSSLWVVLLCGAAVRLCLLAWGEWQDRHMPVAYTDIDYGVFTDGAVLVARGGSPYERITYRYSPLIAWLLLPAVWLPWFGKLLFSACDCLLAALLHSLLSLRAVPSAVSLRCVLCLLFNPLSLAVSTRGNGDVVHLCVLFAMLHCLARHRVAMAAVCYGVAVHLRLYPIIYLPSLLLAIDRHSCPPASGQQRSRDAQVSRLEWSTSALSPPTRQRVTFVLLSAASFCVLFILCALLYGRPFVQESLLHHIGRVDTRHNFSLLFYPLYLAPQGSWMAAVLPLLSLLPQLLLSALCSLRLSSDLPLCLTVQTLLFVAFNKVVTAQYFVWYVSLLPLVLPFARLSSAAVLTASVTWLLAELHWLSWAYQVELVGAPHFLGMHAASCCFFLVSTLCAAALIATRRQQPLFEHGHLTLHSESKRTT